MHIVSRDKNGKLCFHFQYVDMLFDQILAVGMKPIVELGLMPECMASEQAYVFWWKMNISTARDISEWESLIHALLLHLTERYGQDEIATWYFEVWNEPNHPAFAAHPTFENYCQLYSSAARAVRSVCTKYRVGGPATAGLQWLPEFINYCRANDIPLDFVSSHHYGVRGDFDPDGNKVLYLCPIDGLWQGISNAAAVCKEAELEFFVTEWSSSFSPRDLVHDSYVNASYLLYTIRRLQGLVTSLSYWVYTDIFEEISPPETPFHGGFGLLNMQSLKKPSYHVYNMLNRLGETQLLCDDADTFACKNETGYQLLCWNFVQPKTDLDNARYFSEDIPAKPKEDCVVTFEGLLPNKEYTAQITTVGYRKGDAYTAWLDAGSPKHLSNQLYEKLPDACVPPKREDKYISDQHGRINIVLAQTENQADFIELY